MNKHPLMDNVVLIVDDNSTNLGMLSDYLSARGFKVSLATSGEQALKRVERISPDIILLDIMMPPGMDGFDVCQRLKANDTTRDIPVIFLTALSETQDKVKGFNVGAVDYITKPFQQTEVLARVTTHLTIRKLFQENMKYERYRSLAQTVAGVAHELNTPLGVVNTAVNLIANRVKSDEITSLFGQKSSLQAILEDIQEATHLAQSNISWAHTLVQNFKKISVSQFTEDKETLNLAELVREIVGLFSLNAKKAQLRIDVQATLPETNKVWSGYPGCLTQVILNLLSNIERYAYPERMGGRIEIGIAADDGRDSPCFVITIQDFGQGIDPEHLSQIFEPFFTTGRSQGGTGLGLSIMHNIVTEALKGTIEVTSEPGQGTMFTVTFPQTIPE